MTDSAEGVVYDAAARPELAALIRLYCATTREPVEKAAEFAQKAQFKKALTEAVVEALAPVRANLARITAADAVQALTDGAQRARLRAEPVVLEAKRALQLL